MSAPNPSKPYDDTEASEDWPACPMCDADSLFEHERGLIVCLACGETFAEVQGG